MTSNYFSFLLCFHTKQTDIYCNGLPIGQLINGEFKLHSYKLPDGSTRPLVLQDLGNPCPFNSVEELKNRVIEAIRTINIPEPQNNESN